MKRGLSMLLALIMLLGVITPEAYAILPGSQPINSSGTPSGAETYFRSATGAGGYGWYIMADNDLTVSYETEDLNNANTYDSGSVAKLAKKLASAPQNTGGSSNCADKGVWIFPADIHDTTVAINYGKDCVSKPNSFVTAPTSSNAAETFSYIDNYARYLIENNKISPALPDANTAAKRVSNIFYIPTGLKGYSSSGIKSYWDGIIATMKGYMASLPSFATSDYITNHGTSEANIKGAKIFALYALVMAAGEQDVTQVDNAWNAWLHKKPFLVPVISVQPACYYKDGRADGDEQRYLWTTGLGIMTNCTNRPGEIIQSSSTGGAAYNTHQNRAMDCGILSCYWGYRSGGYPFKPKEDSEYSKIMCALAPVMISVNKESWDSLKAKSITSAGVSTGTCSHAPYTISGGGVTYAVTEGCGYFGALELPVSSVTPITTFTASGKKNITASLRAGITLSDSYVTESPSYNTQVKTTYAIDMDPGTGVLPNGLIGTGNDTLADITETIASMWYPSLLQGTQYNDAIKKVSSIPASADPAKSKTYAPPKGTLTIFFKMFKPAASPHPDIKTEKIDDIKSKSAGYWGDGTSSTSTIKLNQVNGYNPSQESTLRTTLMEDAVTSSELASALAGEAGGGIRWNQILTVKEATTNGWVLGIETRDAWLNLYKAARSNLQPITISHMTNIQGSIDPEKQEQDIWRVAGHTVFTLDSYPTVKSASASYQSNASDPSTKVTYNWQYIDINNSQVIAPAINDLKWDYITVTTKDEEKPHYYSTYKDPHNEFKQGNLDSGGNTNERFNAMTGMPTFTATERSELADSSYYGKDGHYYCYYAAGGNEFVVEFDGEFHYNENIQRTFTCILTPSSPCTKSVGPCPGQSVNHVHMGGDPPAVVYSGTTHSDGCCGSPHGNADHPHTQQGRASATLTYTGINYIKITNCCVWKLTEARTDGTSALLEQDSITATIQSTAPDASWHIAQSENAQGGRMIYEWLTTASNSDGFSGGTVSGTPDAVVLTRSSPCTNDCGKDGKDLEDWVKAALGQGKRGAWVVSDFIVLHTSNGDQSILYHEYKTNWGAPLLNKATGSPGGAAGDSLTTAGCSITLNGTDGPGAACKSGWEEYDQETIRNKLWYNNPYTSECCKLPEDGITYGGYNGDYMNMSGKYKSSGWSPNMPSGKWKEIWSEDAHKKALQKYFNGGTTKHCVVIQPNKVFRLCLSGLQVPDYRTNGQYDFFSSAVFYEGLVHHRNDTSKPTQYGYSTQSKFGGKSGFVIENVGYDTNKGADYGNVCNGVVIFNPVSNEDSYVISLDKERDHRVGNNSTPPLEIGASCPMNESCAYQTLECTRTDHVHTLDCYTTQPTKVQTIWNAHKHTSDCPYEDTDKPTNGADCQKLSNGKYRVWKCSPTNMKNNAPYWNDNVWETTGGNKHVHTAACGKQEITIVTSTSTSVTLGKNATYSNSFRVSAGTFSVTAANTGHNNTSISLSTSSGRTANGTDSASISVVNGDTVYVTANTVQWSSHGGCSGGATLTFSYKPYDGTGSYSGNASFTNYNSNWCYWYNNTGSSVVVTPHDTHGNLTYYLSTSAAGSNAGTYRTGNNITVPSGYYITTYWNYVATYGAGIYVGGYNSSYSGTLGWAGTSGGWSYWYNNTGSAVTVYCTDSHGGLTYRSGSGVSNANYSSCTTGGSMVVPNGYYASIQTTYVNNYNARISSNGYYGGSYSLTNNGSGTFTNNSGTSLTVVGGNDYNQYYNNGGYYGSYVRYSGGNYYDGYPFTLPSGASAYCNYYSTGNCYQKLYVISNYHYANAGTYRNNTGTQQEIVVGSNYNGNGGYYWYTSRGYYLYEGAHYFLQANETIAPYNGGGTYSYVCFVGNYGSTGTGTTQTSEKRTIYTTCTHAYNNGTFTGKYTLPCYETNIPVLSCTDPHHTYNTNINTYFGKLTHSGDNYVLPDKRTVSLTQYANQGYVCRHADGTYHPTITTNGVCSYCNKSYSQLLKHLTTTDRSLSAEEIAAETTHFPYGNMACWKPCGNAANHTHTAVNKNTKGQIISGVPFINLDWPFTVYFPNTGDFYGTGRRASSTCTAERGAGYENNMDTTEWIKEKWVVFPCDVTHKGISYRAGERIYLAVPETIFEFYCVLENDELAGGTVEYGTTAINDPNNYDNECPYEAPINTDVTTYNGHENAHWHDAQHHTYVDVVGRIGALTMNDVGDFRYSNFFKYTLADWRIDNIIRKADTSKQKNILTDTEDIRGVPLAQTAKIYSYSDPLSQPVYTNTYGDWDGYIERKSTGNWKFPLTPTLLRKEAELEKSLGSYKNYQSHMEVLDNQPVRIGYDAYMDYTTLGNYYGNDNKNYQLVAPHYFRLNLDTGAIDPCDIYLLENGQYKLINDADASRYMNDATPANQTVNMNWIEEKNRRNYFTTEETQTMTVHNVCELDYPRGESWRYGTYDVLQLLMRNRTDIGSNHTYGESTNATGANFGNMRYFLQGARWHVNIGLPSSAVFVASGTEPNQTNIDNYKKGNYTIVVALEIWSFGSVWNLAYDGATINGPFTLAGKTYDLSNNSLIEYPTQPGTWTPTNHGLKMPDGGTAHMPIVEIVSIDHSSREDMTSAGTH